MIDWMTREIRMSKVIDYLNPGLPRGLRRVTMPVVDATPATLAGYGKLVEHPDDCEVEIVQWPAMGSRPIDPGTGDEAGTTEGVFVSEWRGDILYGSNEAVGGHYVLAYATEPEAAREDAAHSPGRMLLWHANYHPDGGQLFFPLDRKPFYVPLALPGDDITPESFTTFWFDGGKGLYIHPNIWHEALSPVNDRMTFFGRQGKVHARVGANFPKEFGCYLSSSLRKDQMRERL